jgi:regulatory protein
VLGRFLVFILESRFILTIKVAGALATNGAYRSMPTHNQQPPSPAQPFRITALDLQKRNKERVNVYLNGEFAFGLNVLEAAGLAVGQLLSEKDIATLRSKDEVHQALERALHFLGPRPRSITEIRRQLAEKQIDEAVIDVVIERLRGLGYVDDLAFARFWLTNRQTFKPLGERALRFELREKGVPDEVIQAALAELAPDESGGAVESAYRAARDKARRLRGQDLRTFRQKLTALLARRGFDYETAREAIDRLRDDLSADDPAFFGGTQSDDHDYSE